MLLEELKLEDVAEAYLSKCKLKFPLANAFGGGIECNLSQDIIFLPEESEHVLREQYPCDTKVELNLVDN